MFSNLYILWSKMIRAFKFNQYIMFKEMYKKILKYIYRHFIHEYWYNFRILKKDNLFCHCNQIYSFCTWCRLISLILLWMNLFMIFANVLIYCIIAFSVVLHLQRKLQRQSSSWKNFKINIHRQPTDKQ
jgi:hypothetical protein